MEEFVREVGAAKNKLGQLLDLVEQREEITISRHGKEVARLVTVRSIGGREEARAALRRIRERAEQASSVVSTGPSGNSTGAKAASS
jgi:prevent-host-death family protein